MTGQEFRKVYPLIAGWIKQTLAEHASAARPVASFGFSRLPHYYDAQLLASSMVVLVPKVPMPPLSAIVKPTGFTSATSAVAGAGTPFCAVRSALMVGA